MKAKKLCRWLGPAHHIGQPFCSYILVSNGNYIARLSVIAIILDADLCSDDMNCRTEAFIKEVESHIGNYKEPFFNPDNPNTLYVSIFDDYFDNDDTILPYGDKIINTKVKDINEAYTYLDYLTR